MKKISKKWVYSGPVLYHGHMGYESGTLTDAVTYAVSEAAARNNFIAQFKKSRNIPYASVGFALEGDVVQLGA